MPKACVYTVLTGDYETLNEQPVARQSDIRFLCFTDNPDLASDTWEIQRIQPLLEMDPVRSQRDIKIRPHHYLPSVSVTLYIDNAVILKADPRNLFEVFDKANGFATLKHERRETLLDEFIEIARNGMDDPNRVLEQLNHYLIQHPDVLNERPVQSSMIIRDSENPTVRRAMDIWSAHVLRYSRRDQLSANVAFHLAGLEPQLFEFDRSSSPFHSWPHRDNRKPRSNGILAPPPTMLLRESEAQLKQETKRRLALEDQVSEMKRKVEDLAIKAAQVTALEEELEQAKPYLRRMTTIESSGIAGTRAARGGWILTDPKDERGYRLLDQNGTANPNSSAIWSVLLRENAWTHIVDIGANYGEMLLNGDLPKGAKIIAVEPNPKIRRYLIRSLAMAGIKARVKAAAISDQDGKADFDLDLTWSGKSRLAPKVDGKGQKQVRRVRVRTRPLSGLFGPAARPDKMKVLLKIDVEGGEKAVLSGSLALLHEFSALAILIEALHMPESTLDWIVGNFTVEVFDLEKAELHPVSVSSGAELKGRLAMDRFYSQDIVLRRRQPA